MDHVSESNVVPVPPNYLGYRSIQRTGGCGTATIRQSGTANNAIYAIKHHPKIHNGTGFVFSEQTRPRVGIDIDGYKLNPNDPLDAAKLIAVRNILNLLQTYIELSPSGDGFHAFGYLLDPATAQRLGQCRQGLLGCIEIFFSIRYFTMTFQAWRDLPMVDLAPIIDFIMDEHVRLGGKLPASSLLLDDGVTEPTIIPGPPDNRDLLIALTETIEQLRSLRTYGGEDQPRDLYVPLGSETDPTFITKRELEKKRLFARKGNDWSDVDCVVARHVAFYTYRFDVFTEDHETHWTISKTLY